MWTIAADNKLRAEVRKPLDRDPVTSRDEEQQPLLLMLIESTDNLQSRWELINHKDKQARHSRDVCWIFQLIF